MLNSFTPQRLRGALAGAALALAAAATWAMLNVAGTWDMAVETPLGNGNPTFELKQDGDKVTGFYNGAFGSAPVTGKIEGEKLTLVYNVSGSDVTYTGKVTGDKIEGTIDLGSMGQGSFKGTKK